MNNNFKELEKLNIESRVRSQEETKQKINANIQLFGFLGSIIDLYLPKVGEVISSFNRPQEASTRNRNKYPNK